MSRVCDGRVLSGVHARARRETCERVGEDVEQRRTLAGQLFTWIKCYNDIYFSGTTTYENCELVVDVGPHKAGTRFDIIYFRTRDATMTMYTFADRCKARATCSVDLALNVRHTYN